MLALQVDNEGSLLFCMGILVVNAFVIGGKGMHISQFQVLWRESFPQSQQNLLPLLFAKTQKQEM